MICSRDERTAWRIGCIIITSAVRSIELPTSTPASSKTESVRANRVVSSMRQSLPKTGRRSAIRSMIALPPFVLYARSRANGRRDHDDRDEPPADRLHERADSHEYPARQRQAEYCRRCP